MQMNPFRATLLAGLVFAGGCTVHQTDLPPLTGPSELAQSVTVTATPDLIHLGVSASAVGESSSIVVKILDPNGKPQSNQVVRLDIVVGQAFADCGRLSAREVITGSDGRAVAVFTAPGLPMPMPECASFAGTISIVATTIGNNFQRATAYTADIALVPPTIIVPAGAATVSFSVSPNPAKVNAEVTFADAGSAAAPGRSIAGFRWDFSDSTFKVGTSVQHDFGTAGTYTVTLTVTDDIGQQTFKSATVTITP